MKKNKIEFENLKKDPMKIIESIAKQKTEWSKPFQKSSEINKPDNQRLYKPNKLKYYEIKNIRNS